MISYLYANKRRTAVLLVGSLLDDNIILHYDAEVISEILQKLYCSVFSDAADRDTNDLNELTPHYTIIDIIFSATDTIAAINELKNHSALGSDGFPSSQTLANFVVFRQYTVALPNPVWYSNLQK